MDYGGLKESDPKGSGTIRKCDLEVGVVILEEVCYCGGRLCDLFSQASSV